MVGLDARGAGGSHGVRSHFEHLHLADEESGFDEMLAITTAKRQEEEERKRVA